jgi:transcriptional regulator with XRE-family HTH domain
MTVAESCALREWLLTQVDMAKEAGISQKHLSQILTGKVTGSLELWDFLLLSVGVRHKVLTPAPQRSAGGAAGDDRATPAETHSEATMFKVRDALRCAGLRETEIVDAIIEMQNAGILFRERAAATGDDRG